MRRPQLRVSSNSVARCSAARAAKVAPPVGALIPRAIRSEFIREIAPQRPRACAARKSRKGFFSRPRSLHSQQLLGRSAVTDRDVVPVLISECELRSSGARVHVGLFIESINESACPLQRHVEIIDTEKQQEAIARLRVIGTTQRRVLIGTPLVQTEQNRSIRVENLTPVIMAGCRLWQAK